MRTQQKVEIAVVGRWVHLSTSQLDSFRLQNHRKMLVPQQAASAPGHPGHRPRRRASPWRRRRRRAIPPIPRLTGRDWLSDAPHGGLGRAWEGMLQPESITKSIHFIPLSKTGEIFRSDFGAKLHFVMEVLLNRSCVAWTKVVLELCDNPEKLVGYWLFASSGTVFFFIQPMASVRRKPRGGRKNGAVHGVLTWPS